MHPISARRPTEEEFAPYHADYVSLVPERDILDCLVNQSHALQVVLRSADDTWGGHRYAPGKWSVKEVLGHLIDSERIFCYRALCIARGEKGELPGYDHDAYVATANFDRRPLESFRQDLVASRSATLRLFESFTGEEVDRVGIANGQRVTVRGLAFIIAGHERHHLRTLREKYMDTASAPG
jgi:hypothetical protein